MADVFRAYGGELGPLSAAQAQVARAIVRCRTPALGAHAYTCERCSYRDISYNSCRNRHCPKCLYRKQRQWLAKREEELLDVGYFHVVFTIPHVLHPIFRANPKVCYGLLFAAVSQTLKEVALRPKNLGAIIGFMAVLHTWTQKLDYHPHIHCVVPGGGLSPDTLEWIESRNKFFVSTRILNVVFRAKLLDALAKALERGTLHLDSLLPATALLRKAARKKWVVYCKAPFAGPWQVLRYLSRYTHRIAISNARIVSMAQGRVTFRYCDRSDGERQKLLTLAAPQFLRRFLLHVLPKGFVRLRYYGFLAQSQKHELLQQCRRALDATRRQCASAEANPHSDTALTSESQSKPRAEWLCPKCHLGRMLLVARLSPDQTRWFLQGRSTFP